ncbi:hypothetical protein diail_10101 [Diaporthe ilicicola]|nr:hypothetical protein diail_10101 [Diaporthe ilicicola]
MGSTQVITHIVLFKYKPSISWEAFEEHFETLKAVQHQCLHPVTQRPYMLSMRMGKNRGWEPFAKGMTHAFVLEFASQDDQDYYLTKDPVHLEFSRNAHPLIEDSLVVDIRDGVLFGPAASKPPGVTFPGEGGRTWKGACHCGGCELGIVPKEDLKVTKGRPSVYTYKGAIGRDVRCFFCPTCTSHIYHQDAMADKVIVRTLLLEGGNDFEAGGEIVPGGKLSWVQDLNDSLEPVPTKKKAVKSKLNVYVPRELYLEALTATFPGAA